MKNIYLLLTAIVATAAFGQTRLIAHKSHSGSVATFNTALENSLFDITESNFGLPNKEMRFTMDSLIILPDNRVVVVSSEKDVFKYNAKSAISFKPGRDTLYNHPLLSNQHARDSIIRELKNAYEKPVLINYDNEKPKPAEKQQPKRNTVTLVPSGDDNFPAKPMLVFALALLSGVLAFISYLIYKLKSAHRAA